jgi:hypothetical protein
MEELVCNWTPQLIVEIIKIVAWPLTVLIITLKFRVSLGESIRNFFSKNSVSELSATTTGVSAKFIIAKQSSEAKESAGSRSVILPENMTLETINEKHAQAATEFSEELYKTIKNHINVLDLTPEEKVELLAKEASILQSVVRYFDINKVIFRSQFNLFSMMSSNSNYMSKDEFQSQFRAIKETVYDGLIEWDWIKYASYPVIVGLITDEQDGYKLTSFGCSYVSFMSRNPQLIDELSKL